MSYNNIFNNNNILGISKKKDYSMLLDYNDNVINIIISLCEYFFFEKIDL